LEAQIKPQQTYQKVTKEEEKEENKKMRRRKKRKCKVMHTISTCIVQPGMLF
jgi:hypothetical protein